LFLVHKHLQKRGILRTPQKYIQYSRKRGARNGGQPRPSVLLAPLLYKEATWRALFDIIHSSKFGFLLKMRRMFRGKRNFYESRKQTTRAAKEQKQQVHQVPLCLDMCAMQKPQTFN
jgi:hypothetical protein